MSLSRRALLAAIPATVVAVSLDGKVSAYEPITPAAPAVARVKPMAPIIYRNDLNTFVMGNLNDLKELLAHPWFEGTDLEFMITPLGNIALLEPTETSRYYIGFIDINLARVVLWTGEPGQVAFLKEPMTPGDRAIFDNYPFGTRQYPGSVVQSHSGTLASIRAQHEECDWCKNPPAAYARLRYQDGWVDPGHTSHYSLCNDCLYHYKEANEKHGRHVEFALIGSGVALT